MLFFCPTCGNLLLIEEDTTGSNRFTCNTCPYICRINKKISNRIYPKLKVILQPELNVATAFKVDTV